jgi:hypothetical protein
MTVTNSKHSKHSKHSMNAMTNSTPGRLRTVLSVMAVAACVPYLSLKVAWVSGSWIGIPAGSPLREEGASLAAINTLTIVMDAFVVVLALALTRPWGQRLPSWLPALPLWAATGLLGPIAVGFPVQVLYAALAPEPDTAGGSGGTQNDLVEGWVSNTVYTGFVLQALALSALFLLYGRARWGRLLRGRVTPHGEKPLVRMWFAVPVALGALLLAAVHAMWTLGAGPGLGDSRDTGGDAAHGTDTAIAESAFALFALLAAAGVLLAAQRGGVRPLKAPLAACWAGSGVMACWGAWWGLSAFTLGGGALAEALTPTTLAVYAGQMLVGLVIAGFGARLLVRRSALVSPPAHTSGHPV